MTVAAAGYATEPAPPSLGDEALAAELVDGLAHDRRTEHLALEVAVSRGVAHVRGAVRDHAERVLVRRLLRRVSGLHAAWDLLCMEGEELRVLDVGCGGRKQVPAAVGVDRVPGPAVDVVADLEGTLPFEDECADHVFAIHVLEHVRDLLGLMAELHRVLRPTGVLHVLAPEWHHPNAVADPTHCRLMDVQTFRYFCRSAPGVLPWRPLAVSASYDTVHADLVPVKDAAHPSPVELARWFD